MYNSSARSTFGGNTSMKNKYSTAGSTFSDDSGMGKSVISDNSTIISKGGKGLPKTKTSLFTKLAPSIEEKESMTDKINQQTMNIGLLPSRTDSVDIVRPKSKSISANEMKGAEISKVRLNQNVNKTRTKSENKTELNQLMPLKINTSEEKSNQLIPLKIEEKSEKNEIKLNKSLNENKQELRRSNRLKSKEKMQQRTERHIKRQQLLMEKVKTKNGGKTSSKKKYRRAVVYSEKERSEILDLANKMREQKILENNISRKHRFVLRTLRQNDDYYSPENNQKFEYKVDTIGENDILHNSDILDDKKGYISYAYDVYVKAQTNDDNYNTIEDFNDVNYFSDGFASSQDIDIDDDILVGTDASNYVGNSEFFFSDNDEFEYDTKQVSVERASSPTVEEESTGFKSLIGYLVGKSSPDKPILVKKENYNIKV